jgi:DNA polymerase-4
MNPAPGSEARTTLASSDLPLNKNKPFVMHIDLNSCFATVTQQAFPHLRGKPVAIAAYVTPNGCVLSPSIEAKKMGVKTGSTVREAKLLCPDIVVRTADAAMIRDVHVKFKRIFKDYSPNVTPKSIDEAVIDFESMEHLVDGKQEQIAREIKRRMRTEIGEWISCSVGISTNRFLAKLAASLIKPDGLVTITHENVRSVYEKIDLQDLNGIATRMEARLNMYGIYTPLQFLDAPLMLLKQQVFKSINGYYWYLRLRGYEIDQVDFGRKSFGQDYAMKEHTADPGKLGKIIMHLCEKMGRRLRRHGMAARGIHVSVVYRDGTHWHRGRLRERDMYTSQELYRNTLLVFNQQPERKVVSKISVSCYDLRPCESSQPGLFDEGPDKARRLSDAMDRINDRYGEYVITPVMMMGMEKVVMDRIAFGAVKELEDLYAE